MSETVCGVQSEVNGEVVVSENGNDWSDISPSTAVIRAIASVEGTDPVDLAENGGTVLHDHIDPDALDDLVTNSHENDVAVTFSLDRYTVSIDGSELVVAVTESDSSASA